jgi:hypothetical protein
VNFEAHSKESFLPLAKVMPRPIEKQVTDSKWPQLRLKYKNDAITLWVDVPQSLTCELVTPAHDAASRKRRIMAYDPKNPASIFEEDNLAQFAAGLTNTYALRHGLGGDPGREDVGVCMVALEDTRQEFERTPEDQL